MFSRLIAAEIEREDGERQSLDDFEIAGFATLLGGAGAETVTKLVGNAAVTFARFPDQWQKLLDDRSKIPAAVEELLRYEAPDQYNVRRSMKEVELHGVTIPEGKPVFLLQASANRDPEAFTDADTFDIDRDRTEAQNLGFGYGVHSCLGAALARMESAIALGATCSTVMPRYEVFVGRLHERVAEQNVAAGQHVPVRCWSIEVDAIRIRARRFSRRMVLGPHDRRAAQTSATTASPSTCPDTAPVSTRSRRWPTAGTRSSPRCTGRRPRRPLRRRVRRHAGRRRGS